MRFDISIKSSLLTIAIVTLFSCSKDSANKIVNYEHTFLYVEDAKELYKEAWASLKTKGVDDSVLHSNYFYRDEYSAKWDEALENCSGAVASVDVPLKSYDEYVYYAIAADGKGFYPTYCHHSLTVVRNRETGGTDVYNHFYVPGRQLTEEEGLDNYDDELFHSFYNNSYKEGYDGFEFFTNLQGEVVEFNRYFGGELYESIFIGDGKEDTYEYLQWALNFYMRGLFRMNKAANETRAAKNIKTEITMCPECGCTDLVVADGFGTLCVDCGWSENAGGMGGLISGGKVTAATPTIPTVRKIEYPGFVQPIDPPQINGGGGGQVGDGRKYKGFNTDVTFDRVIKPAFDSLMFDCAGSEMIKRLQDQNITFKQNTSMIDLMQYNFNKKAPTTVKNGNTVELNSQRYIYHNLREDQSAPQSILFEELFHAVQVNEGNYDSTYKLNIEIEAKMAAYIYMKKNNLHDFFMGINEIQGYGNDNLCWDNTFGRYLDNPTEANYQRMIRYLQQDGRYKVGYTDNEQFHKMESLQLIFNCDDYKLYKKQIEALGRL